MTSTAIACFDVKFNHVNVLIGRPLEGHTCHSSLFCFVLTFNSSDTAEIRIIRSNQEPEVFPSAIKLRRPAEHGSPAPRRNSRVICTFILTLLTLRISWKTNFTRVRSSFLVKCSACLEWKLGERSPVRLRWLTDILTAPVIISCLFQRDAAAVLGSLSPTETHSGN